MGVVNHFRDIHIPEEDSVALDLPGRTRGDAVLDVAVIQLPHISNFDDFDPLAWEDGVSLRYVTSSDQFGDPDLVILPGTKTTIPDLAWMESRGLTSSVQEARRRGAALVGICGGYQMLGTQLQDPDHIESSQTQMAGLGLLPMATVFAGSKETHRIRVQWSWTVVCFKARPACRCRVTRYTWAGPPAAGRRRHSTFRTGPTCRYPATITTMAASTPRAG